MRSLTLLSVVAFFFLLIVSCKKDNVEQTPDQNDPGISTGLVVSSDNDYLNIPFVDIPFGSTSNLPSSYDLSSDMPPVGNQGNIGSCVAWAAGYYLKSYQEKVQHNYQYSGYNTVMSPPFMYNQIKIGDCQSGSYFVDAFNLLKDQGICTLEQMPFDGQDCETQPNSTQTQQALSNKISSFERLPNDGIVNNIKYYITQNTPIVIGVKVDNAFSNRHNINYEFIYEGLANPSTFSNHAMLVVGYDDGRNAFKVINSWGTNWGNNGYCWINYDLFTDGNAFMNSTVFRAYRTVDEIDSNTNSTGILEVVNNTNFQRFFHIKKLSDSNYDQNYQLVIPGGETRYYYDLEIGVYNYEADNSDFYVPASIYYSNGQINITSGNTSTININN